MDIVPPRLAIIDIVTEPCYVLGFPNYVAVVVTAFPENSSLRRVPVVGWQGTRGMLGMTLFSADGNAELFNVEPLSLGGADTGVPTSALSVGERRRWLLDLSEILPDALEPGHYRATLSFGPVTLRTKAGPILLQFRAPVPEEQQTLDALTKEVEERGTWGQWTSLPPLPGVGLRLPEGPNDPLRFNWVMRQILYGPKHLSTIPLELLDVLDGLFVPEREVLRAEFLAARDKSALARQLERLRLEFPELRHWYERIESGTSPIAWAHRTPGVV